MTREEAISVLKEIIDESWIFSDVEKAPTIDACEMAISALSIPEREKETDVISREAVIDLLNQFGYYDKEMERDLSAIPSAIPEREKGEWILDESDNSVECNKCLCQIYPNDILYGDPHFCPNCGADMRGET